MAITILKDTGYHNSTSKIGEWGVPQVIGDDKPRGNKNYDSWRMTKGFMSNGTTKIINGLNIVYKEGILTLTKGDAIAKGHLFTLEEDLAITGQVIVLGIDRTETERTTYIKDELAGYEPIREELSQDSGIIEFKIWEFIDGEWLMTLPMSKTIKKYKEVLTLESGGNTIYDIEVVAFPQGLIDNPDNYNFNNTIVSLFFKNLGINDEKIFRVRRGESYIDVAFDEDKPKLGLNTIYFYLDEEGKFKATTGGKK